MAYDVYAISFISFFDNELETVFNVGLNPVDAIYRSKFANDILLEDLDRETATLEEVKRKFFDTDGMINSVKVPNK